MPQTREDLQKDRDQAVKEFQARRQRIEELQGQKRILDSQIEQAVAMLNAQNGYVQAFDMLIQREQDGTESARKAKKIIPFDKKQPQGDPQAEDKG